MERKDYVLATLAASPGAAFEPVHVQKILFFLDQKATSLIGGKRFDFKPYAYGPFDVAVYSDLEELANQGLVEIDHTPGLGLRHYRLTPLGQAKGESLQQELSNGAVDYMCRLSKWVRSLPFYRLIFAVYKEYPAMKVNSVFRGHIS